MRKALAERITLGLAEGCVQADLASTRLQNPMLGGELGWVIQCGAPKIAKLVQNSNN